MKLDNIVHELDREFDIKRFGKDPGFSRFLPAAYESVGFEWKDAFEKGFSELFNGLMLKGSDEVKKVFLAVFPSDGVLEHFIKNSDEGDLLFMHHPLLMECGDPRGEWGKGFVPIKEHHIHRMKEKKLSLYTCHEPMDFHKELGTSFAIEHALGASQVDGFLPDENGTDLVHICEVDETSTDKLIEKLKGIFEIPYVDFEGVKHDSINKIAIVAGCGDKVDWMKEAEGRGVQAYVTGEIHCHIDNEYGRKKFQQMVDYAAVTNMSLIGASHSASEYLVHKTLMKDWFEEKFDIETVLIPQEKWWL